MFGFSKLFKTILAVVFAVLLLITTTITVYSQSTVEVLSDRANLQNWLSEEDTQEALIDYVIEKAFSPTLLELGKELLGAEKYEEIVYSQFTKDATEYLTDNTVDAIYDWLEGESTSPVLAISLEETGIDLDEIDEVINEKIGILSDFIDISDLLLQTKEIELLDLEDSTLTKIPQVFTQLKRIPQVFFVVSLVLAFIIVFAAPTIRLKILLISLSIAISGLVILFGFRFYSAEDLIRTLANLIVDIEIPSLSNLPQFLQYLLEDAASQINSTASTYAKYLLLSGSIVAVLSQLAIKSEDVDYGIEETEPEWVTDEEYFYGSDEELEESE